MKQTRSHRALTRDRSRKIVEGEGSLEGDRAEIVTFAAPEQPCLTSIAVAASQGPVTCEGEGIITVTDSLLADSKPGAAETRQGLPGYTFKKAPGELWRSKYGSEQKSSSLTAATEISCTPQKAGHWSFAESVACLPMKWFLRNFPGYSPAQLSQISDQLELNILEWPGSS